MDEKGISCSSPITDESVDTLCPMLFGVSCAYFALRMLPQTELCDDGDDKWSQVRSRMLKGSAHLLGLVLWSAQREEAKCRKLELLQKLKDAEKQIEELKKRRSEDARANEKVVRIVATREQSWSDERKKLRQQIGGLMNDLRVLKMKNERSIAELNEKLKENEAIMHLKDKSIEEVGLKRVEIEEKVKKAENLVEEMRDNAQREAQRHASEILKHKTAFIELVSSQRQLEAEMSRAVRHVEVAKQELDSVLDQKEKLLMELVKMRKDLEQKDQILSAMLRKSKVDTAEKQMLLKEVTSSKSKRQQSELETAQWRAVSESKQDRHSLRNMLSKHVNVKAMVSMDGGNRRAEKTNRSEFDKPEVRNGLTDERQLIADVERLANRANSETVIYEVAIQQRHNLEVEASVEQLRLKDERLDAFRWHLLSMEIESKRLQSHIEGSDHEIAQLRKEIRRLETLLLDSEAELHSLKEQLVMQFKPPNLHNLNLDSSLHEAATNHDTVWSRAKVIKRKPKRQEIKVIAEEISQATDNEKVKEIPADEQLKDIVLTLQYPHKEIKERKVISPETDHIRQGSIDSDAAADVETSTSVVQGLSKKSNSTLKMDIHALGVSYKIKRLKQQFLMLERLMGKRESGNSESNTEDVAVKGLYALTSLLNKQVDRYQSLQGKTDDLCRRMDEKNLNLSCRDSSIARADDETKRLEHFLEETFQLQRYIVATGQKLMEVQAKIASGFLDVAELIDQPESFDMKQFSDSIRTLFREIQRGLEVRISRIIGNLEGTLACNGIIHLKK